MIIDLLLGLSPALEKGMKLKNAETWSTAKTAITSVSFVLTFLLQVAKQFDVDMGITQEEVNQLSGIIGSIGVTVFTHLHVSTNEHLGFTRKEK